MSASNAEGSPAERLARRIVDRLKDERLLDEKDGASLEIKLGRGLLTSADWRVAFEKAVDARRRVKS